MPSLLSLRSPNNSFWSFQFASWSILHLADSSFFLSCILHLVDSSFFLSCILHLVDSSLFLYCILHLVDSSCFLCCILHLVDFSPSTFGVESTSVGCQLIGLFSFFLFASWSILHHTFVSLHIVSISSQFAHDSANDIAKYFSCWMPMAASLHLSGLSSFFTTWPEAPM